MTGDAGRTTTTKNGELFLLTSQVSFRIHCICETDVASVIEPGIEHMSILHCRFTGQLKVTFHFLVHVRILLLLMIECTKTKFCTGLVLSIVRIST